LEGLINQSCLLVEEQNFVRLYGEDAKDLSGLVVVAKCLAKPLQLFELPIVGFRTRHDVLDEIIIGEELLGFFTAKSVLYPTHL